MPLSSCANVSNLVSLAQKFTNSEDSTFKSALHVQYTPQFSFVRIAMMAFSECRGVPNLVILAQNFTNSEDPMCL